MNDVEFSVFNAVLYRVREGDFSIESFGDFSMDGLFGIIGSLRGKGPAALLITKALMMENDSDDLVSEALILITNEGAYRIKDGCDFYEEVYDGYNFGFLPRNSAKNIVRAVFDGNPDVTYLKYQSANQKMDIENTGLPDIPPCYT